MKVISYINTYIYACTDLKKKKKSFNLIIFYHSIIIIVELAIIIIVELASCHSIPTDVQEF